MTETTRIKRPLMVSGAIIIAMGIIFGLQGRGVIGPEESFMYSDPQWSINGWAFMMAGAAMILGAILALGKKSA